MLEFAIVDAHVHLWDPGRFRMPWLAGLPAINRPFGLADYDAQRADLEVEALVYVEVGVDPVDAQREAEWAAALAQSDPRLQGIVAAAPIEQGDRIRPYLETLVALSSRVKGVRRILQDEPDPRFCLRPDFVCGVQLLAELGLSFDLCIVHRQLPAVIELVRQCPGTSFILDHCAKPDIRRGTRDPWRAHIRELAELPNVVCKLSGLVTEADHQVWTLDDLRPYVAHVLDQFGEDRMLFGGDWPVTLLASSYVRWVETLDILTAHLSWEGRRKLWAENARRVYRLADGQS